uniref:Glycine-rich RNA-binding protein 2, mitochondrial n=2 Tax=Anthurium amnicola TaxID=1678845 RepID=A0A1D1YC62_9ARAE
MAFFNKVGGIIRHSLYRNTFSAGHVRCMSSVSSTRLFIGGLSYATDELTLKEAFASFGDVVSAKVITDRDTGRSRGFGFVDFNDGDSAKSALDGMDGQELNGRSIRVSYANERSGGGGGFGGGFGGSGGYRGSGGPRGYGGGSAEQDSF